MPQVQAISWAVGSYEEGAVGPREDLVVGIDLGTSLVKAAVYTVDGSVVNVANQPVTLQQLAPGRTEQDLDAFYDVAASTTRRALADAEISPAQVVAVALCGQMAGVGVVDVNHRPLAPFDSWLDTRCSDVADEMASRAGSRITSVSGCSPTISIGPKMLWWQRHHEEVCERAASFVTAAGFVTATATGLSGREAFVDPSYLHFTSVADVARGRWDDGLIAEFGMDPALLPDVRESTDVVGGLTRQAAEDFGLPEGTPVAAGCGDTAASALGAGASQPNEGIDIAGTAGVFAICTAEFAPDIENTTLMTMRSAIPGRWYALSYVSGSGQVVEWICRELLATPDVDKGGAYERLASAVRSASPGSDGLIFSPHFDGRLAPAAPAMRGTVLGLTRAHTRTHIARAALESIAYEYRKYLDIVGQLQPDFSLRQVIGTGGGSLSAEWNQIKADVLGAPYQALSGVDTGTRGAALVAIASLGLTPPELDATAYRAVLRPSRATRAVYTESYLRYCEWSDLLAGAYRAAATRRNPTTRRAR
jgi:xylulokinase